MPGDIRKRTYRQVLADEAITQDHVIIDDANVGDYQAWGYTLIEDLEGSMSLMKRPEPKE